MTKTIWDPGGAAYSTLRQPPPKPPSDSPPSSVVVAPSTSCRECISTVFTTTAHNPVSTRKRRGARFNRSSTPARLHKRVHFSPTPLLASTASKVDSGRSAFAYTASLSRESTFSIADSGANISVTNPTMVSRFGLTPKLWFQPFDIRFGNNSVFQCTHYADFGAVLGKIAIVDTAPDTLISIASLADRGIET